MQKTGETLTSWGITPNLLGYKYIIDAMDIIRENPKAKHGLHKKVYPQIAERYNTNAVGIERSIRTAMGRLKSFRHQVALPKAMQILVDTNNLCVSAFLATLAELEGGAASETE